jgi:drug/metabolite transporter (DMT)-like permease
MLKKSHLTLKIILLLVFTDTLEAFTQFCFKKSAIGAADTTISSFQQAAGFIQAMLSCGYLWLGVTSVVLIFVIWSTVLSRIDLSVAVPIASFSYVLVPLVSIFYFHEKISGLRWLGIIFILMGVIAVSKSTEKEKSPGGA